jgi:hypothetical protein
MENIQADFTVQRNKFNRVSQILKFNEYGKPSRNYYLTEEEAINMLNNEFVFEDGKSYRVKYLTSNDWRSGPTFQKNENTNISDYVYNSLTEMERYDAQGLAEEDLHIFGIIVDEVLPAQRINFEEF